MDTPTACPQLQVFVVEDSLPVSERLQELVDSIDGAECAGSARTAEDAIAGIRRIRPSAVILDLRLAQGSGFDVMRALRHETPTSEFYVLSSFALEPYRRLALELGAAAFLDKAADLRCIRNLIEQLAARHRQSMH